MKRWSHGLEMEQGNYGTHMQIVTKCWTSGIRDTKSVYVCAKLGWANDRWKEIVRETGKASKTTEKQVIAP